MKLVTIIGARPQFIKAAPVSEALAHTGIEEVVVDTGQHYDDNMAAAFVREFGMRAPTHTLGVGSGTHGAMTGRMLEGAEAVLLQERPDAVLVFGDTNSTLAGALAAAKLGLPVIHVEAGLRSRRTTMAEEVNRKVTDHISTILCCPTASAVENLIQEGVAPAGTPIHLRSLEELKALGPSGGPLVVNVGDVMVDALRRTRLEPDGATSPVRGSYALVTIHRAESTDDPVTLQAILEGLSALADVMTVMFPMHPRTRGAIHAHRLTVDQRIRTVAPLGHGAFTRLTANARIVVTDSGGVQKEACMLRVPCLTVRNETEWTETIDAGWNILVGAPPRELASLALNFPSPKGAGSDVFGDGNSAGRIATLIASVFCCTNAHAQVSPG